MMVSEIMAAKPNSSRARLIFGSAESNYGFGPDHPLQGRRLDALMDLLESSGLWRSSDEKTHLPLRAAKIEELKLIHTSDYIVAVQRLTLPVDTRETSAQQE